MRGVQPPIENDDMYRAYQSAAEKLTKVVESREEAVFKFRGTDRIEAARGSLLNILIERQAILDAIHAYEIHRQSA